MSVLNHYDKGLPLDKALHPDTILAWGTSGNADLGPA